MLEKCWEVTLIPTGCHIAHSLYYLQMMLQQMCESLLREEGAQRQMEVKGADGEQVAEMNSLFTFHTASSLSVYPVILASSRDC